MRVDFTRRRFLLLTTVGIILPVGFLAYLSVKLQREMFSFQNYILQEYARFSVDYATYHSIPYGGSMHLKATVVGAPGRPAAFKLDGGRLWPVSCIEAVTANQSTITGISAAQWDASPKGPSLFCVK